MRREGGLWCQGVAETDGNTFPRANATPLANAGRASAPEGTVSLHAEMKQQRRGFNEILKSPPVPSRPISTSKERLICVARFVLVHRALQHSDPDGLEALHGLRFPETANEETTHRGYLFAVAMKNILGTLASFIPGEKSQCVCWSCCRCVL